MSNVTNITNRRIKRTNLRSTDIVRHKFSNSFKGYSQDEVDDIMKLIAEDYKTMEKISEGLLFCSKCMKEDVNEVKEKIGKLKQKITLYNLSENSPAEILKRIEILENKLKEEI